MTYDLHIHGPETRALVDLADPGALPRPPRPNSRTMAGAQSLLWLGPGRWLLMAPLGDEAALEATLGATPGAVLLSDSLAFFTLSGADAGVAMAIACPLDLHRSAFADDAAAWTDAFGTRALVLRQGADWVLAVEPSFADYVADHLRRIV